MNSAFVFIVDLHVSITSVNVLTLYFSKKQVKYWNITQTEGFAWTFIKRGLKSSSGSF